MKNEPLILTQDVQDRKELQYTHAMTSTGFSYSVLSGIEINSTCTTESIGLIGSFPNTQHEDFRRHIIFRL